MTSPSPEGVEHLVDAQGWYLSTVARLTEGAWREPSRCTGWDASRVVAHVAVGDLYIRAFILEAAGRDKTLLASLAAGWEEMGKRADAMAQWEPARLREVARSEATQMVAELVDLLRRAPDTVLRTTFGESPVTRSAFIRTSEYIIHGYDLEPATGPGRPIPAWFASVALPQMVQLMPRMHQRSSLKGKRAHFHFHRLDGEGEWSLLAENGEARLETGHTPADVSFLGPAEGLYWVLMGRGGPADQGVEIWGDLELAKSFKEWFPGP